VIKLSVAIHVLVQMDVVGGQVDRRVGSEAEDGCSGRAFPSDLDSRTFFVPVDERNQRK
jgi:hypothetical protein